VSFTLEDGTQIVYFYGDRSIVSTESSVVSECKTPACARYKVVATINGIPPSFLSSGNADEGITYSIKGTNADKFLITDTGILTYKAIQTSVHND
jgi:hypothetical protein